MQSGFFEIRNDAFLNWAFWVQPGDVSHTIWSPAMKRTLHHSNKTRVALKRLMVTYTTMNRAGKHSEQLTYRMTEYVITDEKLAEK